MATKLKKLSRSFGTKLTAFLVTILTVVLFFYCILDIEMNVQYKDSLYSENYSDTASLGYDYNGIINKLKDLTLFFQNEDYIKSGALVSDNKLYNELNDEYSIYIDNNNLYEVSDETETYEKFMKDNSELVDAAKKNIISRQLRTYNEYKISIEKRKGIYYYATNGTDIYTNATGKTEAFFKSQPSYVLIDFEDIITKPESMVKTYEMTDMEYYADGVHNIINPDKYKIYVAMTDEYLKPLQDQWSKDRAIMIRDIAVMVVSFIIGLIAFIYLIMVAGRRNEDEELHLNVIDRLWNDVNIGIIMFTILMCGSILVDFLNSMDYYQHRAAIYYVFIIAVVVCGSSICLGLFLSLIKHIKNRTFIRHTCVYTVCSKLYGLFSSIISAGPLTMRIVGGIIIYSGAFLICIMAFFPLGIALMALAIYLAYKKSASFKAIQNGVKYVKSGELDYKISVDDKGDLKILADDINSIADGLKSAVAQEVKSERMKSELITNVSHDIKTPLTSIITYVDLMKREGLDSENAPKYLDILDQKSQRLKTLTEDLFDAAKASSGSIDVNLERVDVLSLIQQGLAELDDKVQASGLDFRINAPNTPEERVFAKADGRLLWRIIENLLSNVFKYGLTGSRVYIDIRYYEDKAVITVKNISAYELNISADELMERFTRGDESRNTEGSGLGLNIAKSLSELQHGTLKIKIDGDLFKAQVMLPADK